MFSSILYKKNCSSPLPINISFEVSVPRLYINSFLNPSDGGHTPIGKVFNSSDENEVRSEINELSLPEYIEFKILLYVAELVIFLFPFKFFIFYSIFDLQTVLESYKKGIFFLYKTTCYARVLFIV